MPGKETHIIKSQVIDMATNCDDGFVIQQEISRLTNEHLTKEMALLFDRLVPADQWVYIDKLNIELDTIERTKLESEFVDKTLQAVENALRSKLSYSIDQPGTQDRPQSKPARLMQVLIHFLEKGYLPWTFSLTNHSDLEEQLIEVFGDSADPVTSGVNNLSGLDIKQLKEVFRSTIAVRRFVDQFSDEAVKGLLLLFTAGEYELMKSEFPAIKAFIQQLAAIKGKIFHEEWKKIKELLVTDLAKTAEIDPVHHFEKNLVRNSFLQHGEVVSKISVPASLLNHVLTETGSGKELMKEYILMPQNIPAELLKEKEMQKEEMQEKKLVHPADEKEMFKKEDEKTEEKDILIKKKKEYQQEEDEKEGIYISNAGLVILAPFLSSFFKQVGLTEGKDIADRSKAVCLLQYLTGYNKDWKEYDMPLNKILCGAEPGDRIDTDIELSENGKNEAVLLLQAVIRNWGSLGNTSIEGLQESFLQRNGKLTRKSEDWLLQVEQKSYDMLLQHLPWTISMVKLPWMKCMVRTEWIN
ncbi:MAG: hypothetical protein HOP10_04205 [Chitinophagaceae bacterium]|nr:hypothetical protein [Chitinophagaceae bacterium]